MCNNCIHNKYCDFPECINPSEFEPPLDESSEDIEFTKGVELIVSMSTDFLLGNLDRETYSNNLSIYADYMKGRKERQLKTAG